jgi:hypothetical protein
MQYHAFSTQAFGKMLETIQSADRPQQRATNVWLLFNAQVIPITGLITVGSGG